MDYNEESFWAGVVLGQQLRGWAVYGRPEVPILPVISAKEIILEGNTAVVDMLEIIYGLEVEYGD